MTPIDLLVTNASQLVTCATGDLAACASSKRGPAPKRGGDILDPVIIPGGAVAIDKGRILATGPTAELTQKFTADETLDASGKAVCPGFVDAHTHVVYAGDRLDEFELKIRGAAYLDILAAGGGIHSTVRHVREASLECLVAETLPRLREMLQVGTTTAEVKTGYGLDTATELKMLDAIEALDAGQPIDLVPTFLGAHAVPPEFAGRAEQYVECIIEEQIPAAAQWYRSSSFARRGVPFFVDVFCERNAFSLDQSRRILEAGIAHGMCVKAHVDEFTHLGGAALALSLNAASIDHLDVTTAAELNQAADASTVCVLLPAVNFHFGSAHFADARAMLDAGAAVALATDRNPGSAPCPSMPLVMAIACRYQKLLPAEALHAITINAAAATGIGAEAGSLEPGKRADLLILKSADYRSLAYEFGGNPIETVIKRGEVYRNA
jgi:imidazolonepropionase